MFLTRRLASVAREDRGAAMLAAIGLTAVAAVIALVVTSSTLFSVGYTTATRAGVQAQAAAEGGIDFAAASLGTAAAVCQNQYVSTTTPVFTVDVYYSNADPSPVLDTDSSWMSGCPPTLLVKRLKLVSTGTAANSGLAGNISGNTRKVEAIYKYTLTAPPWLTGTGAAIYSYAQTDTTVNNLTINNGGTVPPTIQYLSGSFSCTSGSTITGNVILGSGVASLASGCSISGNLYASGTINLQSSTVSGDVSASDGTYPSVSLSPTATVGRNVLAAGPVKIAGKVGGSVVAGPTPGVSVFSSQARVELSVKVAGTVSNSGTIVGSITQNQAGMVAPIVPTVPRWVDYPYTFADWLPGGFLPTPVTGLPLAATACSGPGFTTTINTALASMSPHVVDASNCSLDFSTLSSTQTMNSDLVIVAKSFNFSNNNFVTSSSGPPRKLWFIIPDRGTLNNHVPDCPIGGGFTMGNHVSIGSNIAAMIYSPCPITNSANSWTGQIYSSSTKTSNAFTLNYVPIGIPGVNFGDGNNAGETPPPPVAFLGARTSIRTLNAV
jgi:cytoskeletal protein CcmA (bactofilin family)